jgi:hypothetical protein
VADLAVDYVYRYRSASRLDAADGATLHLATFGGPATNPRLFRGRVANPVLFADALLAVGAVARSRFHVPPAMLARVLLLADPVATVSADALRFEAFSSCASVYARLDLLPGFADGEFLGAGSTNVDLGPEVRAALAGVPSSATLGLEVGLEDLAVEVDGERHEERRVALPSRWVRGFAETQAVLAAMEPRLTASGAAFRRLLRDLPRGARDPVHVGARGAELTLARRPAAGAVAVADADRLRVLERLAPWIATIAVHASDEGSSAWVAELAGARFTLALSPAAWRGFSGEGRVADAVGGTPGRRARAGVAAALAWGRPLRPRDLAQGLGADPGGVRAALGELAAAGLVGFDLADGSYFARRLPFAAEDGDRRQPRLRRARLLVDAGAVRLESSGPGGDATVAWVEGRAAEYRVRIGPGGRACTCPWWGRHPGDRGPCAHILAAELAATRAGDAEVRDDA